MQRGLKEIAKELGMKAVPAGLNAKRIESLHGWTVEDMKYYVESQCKEDWKLTVVSQSEPWPIDVSMQRGLKVCFVWPSGEQAVPVSMQRGLKVAGHGFFVPQYHGQSQCKEDWKADMLPPPFLVFHLVSMQRGLKATFTFIALKDCAVSMQRGLKGREFTC